VVRYLYHPEAGIPSLELNGEAHHYLFRVRRHREGECVALRNLVDGILYHYRIETLQKRLSHLVLTESESLRIAARTPLHIGWCIIDSKQIEKTLPMLNEIGVAAITFLYCARSQQQIRLDFERLQKILLNSSQQCGRSEPMVLAQTATLQSFLGQYPEASLLHFSDRTITPASEIETLVIGCEGGWTSEEIAHFEPDRIVGFGSDLILRSESAACAAAAKLLL
jgi:16S rRNA (uracil1498-N3)-methyltransferase